MIYTRSTPPSPDINRVSYTPPLPGAPRCSLDFKIRIDDGMGNASEINDTQLRLERFQGHESLSQPFEFQLELAANDTLEQANPDSMPLDFSQLLGANATILLGQPETDNDVNNRKYPAQRPVVFFNGIITNFALAERSTYHATLKPALFKLSLQNHYRIFSDSSLLDVIMQVLSENSIQFNKSELESSTNKIVTGLATYRKQDWLQAGESDLDFILRLMHKVNLFYYFTHELHSHTMILTDQPYYQTIYQRTVNEAGYSELTDKIKPLYLSYTQQASLDRDDQITQFKYQQNLTTMGLTTVLAQKEATWESQNTAQTSPVYLDREHQKEKLNMQQMHVVQYGATESELGKLSDTAMNRLAASQYDFSGTSSCPELKAGHKFQVQESWRQPSNQTPKASEFSSPLPIRPQLNDREFVAISVQHQASALGDYKNQFSAVAAEGLPTPFNPQEGHQGNILARVTAKPTGTSQSAMAGGNEIEPIEHIGSSAKQLEKTVFTYDSKDFIYADENNGEKERYSCRGIYVRFIDQPEAARPTWVKLAEHMQSIPEIGVYVIVSRSQDANEIPEVQQSLEAKGSKVIMPEGYTCQTNVGNSFSTNYGNSTSIGFGADITTPLETATNIVNGQRDSNNYNHVSYGQSSSYGYNVSPHSHSISLTGSGSPPVYNPSGMMSYVQYNHNVTRGNVYGESEMYGNTDSKNTVVGVNNSVSTHSGAANSAHNMNGATNSVSNTNGTTNSAQNFNGVSNNVNITLGMENSATTKTGMFNSAHNVNGLQNSASFVTGNVTSWNKTIGNNMNTSITIGNSTQSSTTTGNSTSNTNVVGNSTTISTTTGNSMATSTTTGNSSHNKTVIGNSSSTTNITGLVTEETFINGQKVGTSTVASSSETATVGSKNGTGVVMTDNSIESKTSNNTVSNVSSGTTTTNDTSVATANRSQVTEIHAGTRVML